MRPLPLALVHLHHTLVYDKSGGHDVAHGMYATYVVKSTLLSGMNCQCTYLYIHCPILVLCTYIKSSCAPLSPTPLTPIHPPPPPPPATAIRDLLLAWPPLLSWGLLCSAVAQYSRGSLLRPAVDRKPLLSVPSKRTTCS